MATSRKEFLRSLRKGAQEKDVSIPTPPRPTTPPTPKPQKLPGLHITAQDLANGLEYAAHEVARVDIMDTTIQGARDLLATCFKAYFASGLYHPGDDLPEVAIALKTGQWTPSLNDLIEAGLTTKALQFMPACEVVVKLPQGDRIPMLPVDLWRLRDAVPLSIEDHQTMIQAIGTIINTFPGATIKAWSMPTGDAMPAEDMADE